MNDEKTVACITDKSLQELGCKIEALANAVTSLNSLLETKSICTIGTSLKRIADAMESQGNAIRRDTPTIAAATRAITES